MRDERALVEIQNLINKCEQPISLATTNNVYHIKKHIRIGREMRLSAQIGDYDMDEVILDLGFEVNVLTKQTWELMGRPKLSYSPIQLKLSNQQKVWGDCQTCLWT